MFFEVVEIVLFMLTHVPSFLFLVACVVLRKFMIKVILFWESLNQPLTTSGGHPFFGQLIRLARTEGDFLLARW